MSADDDAFDPDRILATLDDIVASKEFANRTRTTKHFRSCESCNAQPGAREP